MTEAQVELYRHLDRRFGELEVHLRPFLSPSELEEVLEFVEAGEYGVALETLLAIIVEERKTVPRVIARQLQDLSTTMGIPIKCIAGLE